MNRWLWLPLNGLAFAAAMGSEPTRWLRGETEHFEIYTTAGERTARDTLRRFEEVWGYFQTVFPSLKPDGPVRIVAFNTKKEFEPYRTTDFAAAYYRSDSGRDCIVLGGGLDDRHPVAIHEYVHLLLGRSGLKLPLWLNEGLAELYSTLHTKGGQVFVGHIIQSRHAELIRDKWIPLEKILDIDPASTYYSQKSKAGGFYNQSWALAHMLVLEREYKECFPRLLAQLDEGIHSAEALAETYGRSLTEIEKDLRDYVRGAYFEGSLVDARLERFKGVIPVEPADRVDVGMILAQLLHGAEAEERRVAALEELAASNPERPEPHIALGRAAREEGNMGEAVRRFAQAFSLGDRSPGLLWEYGTLVSASDPEESLRVFGELLQQEPDRADVRVEMAWIEFSRDNARACLRLLKPIRKVTAAIAPRLFRVMAYAFQAEGELEEAESASRRWLETADPREKPTAKHFLDLVIEAEAEAVAAQSR